MPILHIVQTPGQSPEAKKELLEKLTSTYVEVTGAKPASVWATIEEVSKDDWSIGGETLADRAAKAALSS
ncbi:4-oxalocrotonate tautomerase [Rhodococcus sp. 06-412-2C]|uniref:tautomerase family protein n=1 Tax=Nocardiaceae TaxID=85025 RepID=UPI0005603F3C|nr:MULTISPECIES: tautomerase family protein [Rhodococcus]OZC83684.1 4-oxalocrotonate tautomerase [Rhodococcus sp. 06-412-2C]OZC93871.1 4-oxalocrotonate tautomerase [Rhodococcus sp. 06-412-2B]QII08075.1 4-oxalocrotonate tautomerase family protein [Rhodococcus fascians A25f]